MIEIKTTPEKTDNFLEGRSHSIYMCLYILPA